MKIPHNCVEAEPILDHCVKCHTSSGLEELKCWGGVTNKVLRQEIVGFLEHVVSFSFWWAVHECAVQHQFKWGHAHLFCIKHWFCRKMQLFPLIFAYLSCILSRSRAKCTIKLKPFLSMQAGALSLKLTFGVRPLQTMAAKSQSKHEVFSPLIYRAVSCHLRSTILRLHHRQAE